MYTKKLQKFPFSKRKRTSGAVGQAAQSLDLTFVITAVRLEPREEI